MLVLILSDELRNFGVRTDGLKQDNVARIQKHPIRAVHLVAAPHQNVRYRLGLLVHPALDVVHVGQLSKAGALHGQACRSKPARYPAELQHKES